MATEAPSIETDVANFNKLSEAVTAAAGKSHDLMQSFLDNPANTKMLKWDPMGVGSTFLDLTMSLMKQPDKILEAHKAAWDAHVDLWAGTLSKMLGNNGAGNGKTKFDKRFKHEAWEKHPFFDYVKQSYLVTADTIQSLVADAEHEDEKTAAKAEFYTKLFVEALSPSNFALTNPEVLETTIQSKGENLVKGMQNFVNDFDTENGQLRIRMTDLEAFELGKNVAVTPGKVVFQNRMMQLLQYSPSTKEVNKRPLLIVPPWINKFYVMDLQPKNSMIKWAVDQGHTVFVISWVNPDETYRDVDFGDYVIDGTLVAMDAVEQATGEKSFNVAAYCIGGTLLAATLAYMAEKKDDRIASATFFTTMLDFSYPGELGVFIDEKQLSELDEQMFERGFHDGKRMAMTFNLMRSNDLIWSFFINNYLMGKEPFPFDLLYWNSDSTRMPAKMHSTYLRCMYLNNDFKDGKLTVGDTRVDLSKIKVPSYFISAEEDHIAPWKSTYLGTSLFSGPVTFVLGKSGHIAGIINPPAANKYGYFTGPKPGKLSSDEWYEKTKFQEGSWWTHWDKWLQKQNGGKDAEKVPAREPGDGKLKPIEDAPGSYVAVR